MQRHYLLEHSQEDTILTPDRQAAQTVLKVR
jgi:hypothetical protein